MAQTIVVAAALLTYSYAIYSIFLKCCFSRYRSLPHANQPCVLKRLFHEPSTFELEVWARNVPNNGMIRYFGFLNEERLMITTIEAFKELLLRDADKYDKLSGLSALQSPVGVSGLVSAKGALHKVRSCHGKAMHLKFKTNSTYFRSTGATPLRHTTPPGPERCVLKLSDCLKQPQGHWKR